MAHNEPPTQSLNIPSLLLCATLLAFSLYYYFYVSSTSSTPSNRNTASPEAIEQISQMFPQLSRRDIQWDLQRNGGSVGATAERVLAGGGLERPPPSFQPVLPSPPASSTNPMRPTPAPPKSSHPDLITRYNLAARLSSPAPESETGGSENAGGGVRQATWSQNKVERQSLLQKRREDMVLAARRKLEERERAREKGKGVER